MIYKQIGHKIVHLHEVDSTNNYTAIGYKSGEIAHGTVIMADNQTEGKGQRGKIWQSHPYLNLTFSFLLTNLKESDIVGINHLTALSIVNVLNHFNIKALVKWPNDIYYNNKKIAGILIENIYDSEKSIQSIVGVGINVNQTEFDLAHVTSFKQLTKKDYPLKELLFEFIRHFNEGLQVLNSGKKAELLHRYNQLLWGKELEKTFIINEQRLVGTILETNDKGHLKIDFKTHEGEFMHGEVIFEELSY
jgi:BirA family biotin operon repressor/biotin-[acetyl-CoA-carboxylase] ligase